MTLRGKAYAKLNLTLDIVGRKDGYHMLDSLVTTVDCYDTVKVRRRKDGRVTVTSAGAGSEAIGKNNAEVAAEKFMKRFSTEGADIRIEKNIPIGAGMGGSSADSAGVLRLLAKLYGVTDRAALKELADECGSDTGYLLTGGLARLRGRGEHVEFFGSSLNMPPLYFLILLPKDGVSTPECFRTFDEGGMSYPNRTQIVADALAAGDFGGAARNFSNALYESACRLNPEVREALVDLKSFSPPGAAMTGSGSACYFVSESRELCEWARSRYTGNCRTMIVRSVPGIRI